MTEEQIIKALECCAQPDPICKECPYYDPYLKYPCADQLKWAALNLIDSQKAEIEELEAEIDKQYEQAKADILGNMADGGTSCHWCIDQHRAEAVKEFAVRLTMQIQKQLPTSTLEKKEIIFFCLDEIDNLVKEFTEDKT